jgi:hypothetical protein
VGHAARPRRGYFDRDLSRLSGEVAKLAVPEIARISQAGPAPYGNRSALEGLLRDISYGRFASGGIVPGPEGDWTDSVSTRLPVGAYVLRKSAVRALGLNGAAGSGTSGRGGRGKYAAGGVVDARVMPGEFVFTPDEVLRVGRNNLDRLNRVGYAHGGLVKHYAGGGEAAPVLPGGTLTSYRPAFASDPTGTLYQRLREALAQKVASLRTDLNQDQALTEADRLLASARKRSAVSEAASVRATEAARDAAIAQTVSRKASEQADRDEAKAKAQERSAGKFGKRGAAAESESARLAREAESLAKQRDKAAQEAVAARAAVRPVLPGLPNVKAEAAAAAEARAGELARRQADVAAAAQGARARADRLADLEQRARDRASNLRQAAEGSRASAAQFAERAGSLTGEAARQAVLARNLDRKSGVLQTTDFLGRPVVGLPNASVAAAPVGVGRDTLKGLAQERAEALARGRTVSNEGRTFLEGRAAETTRADYVRAVSRQFLSQDKTISVEEARRLARERFDKAQERNSAKLDLRDPSAIDAVLGRRGPQVAGDKALGASPSQVGGYLREKGRQLRDKFSGGLDSQGAFALAYTAPVITDAIRRSGPSAEEAASGHGTLAFRAAGSLAEGTQTGLVGLTAASAFGATGKTLGAVGGAAALYGFIEGLRDAEKALTEAKIGLAVQKVANELNALTGNLKNFGPASASLIEKELGQVKGQTAEKARQDTSYLFGLFNRSDAFATHNDRLQRVEFGKQLPGLITVLNQQLERAAKEPGNRDLDGKGLLDKVLGENGNFFGNLVNEISKNINSTPGEFKKRLQDTVGSYRSREAGDRANRDATSALNASVSNLDALVYAAKSATSAVERFGVRLQTLADLADSAAGPAKLTNFQDVLSNPGTSDRRAYLEAAGGVAGFLGPAGRGEILGQASALNAVTRALPDAVLSARRGRGAGNGEPEYQIDLAGDIAKNLRAATADTPQADRLIKVVQAKLGSEKFENLFAQSGNDVHRLVKLLTDEAGKALTEAFLAIEKEVREAGQRYADVLGQAAAREGRIREDRSAADRAEVQAIKLAAADTAEKAGRVREAAIDFVPLETLQRPFANAQRALAPGVGNPLSPQALAARLAEVDRQVPGAEAAVRQAQLGRGGPGGERAFVEALASFEAVRGESNKLVAALRNLGDASNRAGPALEKLGRLQAEESGRLGGAERYATSSFEDRFNLNRGVRLAQRVGAADGNVRLTPENARLFLDVARTYESVPLFQNKTGADLRKQFLEANVRGKVVPDAALPPGERGEKASLQDEILQANKDAAAALRILADRGETFNRDVLTELRKLSQVFAESFKVSAAERAGQVAESAKGLASEELTKLKPIREALPEFKLLGLDQPENEKFLRRLGSPEGGGLVDDRIRLAEQYSRAVSERDAVAGLRANQFGGGRSSLVNRDGEAVADPTDTAFRSGPGPDSQLNDLVRRGLIGEDAAKETLSRFSGRGRLQRSLPGLLDDLKAVTGGRVGPLEEDLRKNYAKIGPELAERTQVLIQHPEINRARLFAGAQAFAQLPQGSSLTGDQGGLVGLARRTVAPGGVVGRANELEAELGRLSTAVRDMGEAARLARLSLEQLGRPDARGGLAGFSDRAFEAANTGRGGILGLAERAGVNFLAGGGSPFKPRGTDTIPAMLSEGEYVVNARSAAANAGLLNRINSTRGPLYRAGGGDVWWDEDASDAEARERLRRKVQAFDIRENAPRLAGLLGRSAPGSAASLVGPRARGASPLLQGLLTYAGAASTSNLAAYATAGIGESQFLGLGRTGVNSQRALDAAVLKVAQRENYKTAFYAGDEENQDLIKFLGRTSSDRPLRFAGGGVVPGPRGAGDVVHALLSPGERVLPRYLAEGGSVDAPFRRATVESMAGVGLGFQPTGRAGPPAPDVSAAVTKLSEPIGKLDGSITAFGQHVGKFEAAVARLAETAEKLDGLKIEAEHTVNHFGGAASSGPSDKDLTKLIRNEIDSYGRRKFPDAI